MNTADAAKAIGVKQYYVSAIRSESSWSKCSPAAWEAARRWTNLGMSLKKYGERMKMDKMVNEAFDKKEAPKHEGSKKVADIKTKVTTVEEINKAEIKEAAADTKQEKEPIVWEAVDEKEVEKKKSKFASLKTEENIEDKEKKTDAEFRELLKRSLKGIHKNQAARNKISIAATILIAWFFIWTIVGVHTVNDSLHIVGKMLLDGFLAIVFSALWIWVRTWIMTTKWKLW
ncbi:MAG: hypothetical protein JRJ57_00295 [Deltaproteobacteria bacterium]|nr:hypothetical protein [Deltaproteobacteria bacterium]